MSLKGFKRELLNLGSFVGDYPMGKGAGRLQSMGVTRELFHSEGDQPWDFFGGNDAKAEAPGLWPPHAKSRHIGKDSDAGRDWGQEEKGTTEDEMAGWHH